MSRALLPSTSHSQVERHCSKRGIEPQSVQALRARFITCVCKQILADAPSSIVRVHVNCFEFPGLVVVFRKAHYFAVQFRDEKTTSRNGLQIIRCPTWTGPCLDLSLIIIHRTKLSYGPSMSFVDRWTISWHGFADHNHLQRSVAVVWCLFIDMRRDRKNICQNAQSRRIM